MGNAASIGKQLREELSKTLSDVMISAAERVTLATPVDTTNAANNWILTVGAPFGGVDGSRESPSHAMQDAGIDRIARYDVGQDGPIYLRNNVLYLQFLDRGWSSQAEAGFVARALNSAAAVAPRGRRASARKILKRMSKSAYVRGY